MNSRNTDIRYTNIWLVASAEFDRWFDSQIQHMYYCMVRRCFPYFLRLSSPWISLLGSNTGYSQEYGSLWLDTLSFGDGSSPGCPPCRGHTWGRSNSKNGWSESLESASWYLAKSWGIHDEYTPLFLSICKEWLMDSLYPLLSHLLSISGMLWKYPDSRRFLMFFP